jgi:TonB family protein
MIEVQDRPLAAFAHRGRPDARDPAGRLLALAATIIFYALLLLLAWRGFVWVAPQGLPVAIDATVQVLPSAPQPRLALEDFTVRLIRPKPQNAPLPEIVVRPDSSASRAALPATAARDTPMAGGGAGTGAGAIGGVGAGGSGAGTSACMDPAYLDLIKRHVAHWYFYPMPAQREIGVAYVHFVIDRSGHYKTLALARGTGNIWLDAAALRTMQLAEPLPPIPERFHTDRLDGLMPIIYQHGLPLSALQLAGAPKGC